MNQAESDGENFLEQPICRTIGVTAEWKPAFNVPSGFNQLFYFLGKTGTKDVNPIFFNRCDIRVNQMSVQCLVS